MPQGHESQSITISESSGGMWELLGIAFPMMISQTCDTLMMFTDRFFLSKVGPEVMSAAMGGGVTCFMFMTFFLGLTGFAGALVAQYLGANQKDLCGKAMAQAFWLSLASAPIIVCCIPLGHWLFDLNKLDPAQLAPQKEYFNIIMIFTVLGLLRNVLSCFFTGIGRNRVVIVAASSALSVNVVATYILVFGKFGFPAMGIRGAAIGTVLGSIAALVVLFVRYFRSANRVEFGVLSGLRFDWPIMKKLFRFGTPSGCEFFLNLTAFNVLVLSFHSYGKVAAAAMTIMLNWEMLSFVPMLGVGMGVTSLVGRYMGAQQVDVAHRSAMSGIKIAGFYALISFVMFCIFPENMVGVFRPQGGTGIFWEIEQLATFMLRMVVIYIFADAMMIVFSSALRGAGDTFWTMVISVTGHWIFATSAIIMVRFLHVPAKTTWTVTVFFILLLGISMFIRYRSGKWRTLKVVDKAMLQPVDETEITL